MNHNIIKFLQMNRGNWVVQNNFYNLSINDALQANYTVQNTLHHILLQSGLKNDDCIFSISDNYITDYLIIPNSQNTDYDTGIIVRDNRNFKISRLYGKFLLNNNFSLMSYFNNDHFQIYEKIWFEHINLRLKIQVVKEFGHTILISFSSEIRKQN
uniref:Chromophore lyase cpcS/cpeS n=1 Tax=Bulboplastis apyrenoidosa TaxID=1070855 RepID=A0A1X9PTN1_9RHOD|nr:chromophore lyase cpcS/cpeS [Bulboplastis apyrenoidosa]ARO90759.1 chromophore lyase cpcS/cpeS [Bulboplastis apyrenoidosa]